MVLYSHSRLSTFETCPLKYKFTYIDKIRSDEEESIETFMGTHYHDTMEKLYGELRYQVMTLDKVLAYFNAEWDKEYSPAIKVTKKGRTAEDYRALARKCIEEYYKTYHPFNQSKTLGIEQRVKIDLKGDGKYLVQGFIDRLSQAPDGTYEIHDYKTNAHLPEQKKQDEDRQLALYQIGVQGMWADVKKVRLVWHFVVFNKEIVSTRTPEVLQKLKDQTVALIDKIEGTREFNPCESSLCGWCEHQGICPLFAHPCKVEELPPSKYLKDGGVKLVNTLRDLNLKKKVLNDEICGIEAEQDLVKEALVKFSVREGVQVVQGSGYKAKVVEKTKWCFPSKSSPERETMDAILRKADLWDGLSELDTHALQEMIEENKVPKDVAKMLKPLYKTEDVTSVSLSKLKSEEE
ncbi:MAG: PD-(D/E)XK nuclease family protein [Candidatus Omnitrophica bacterium]|nr:PD-(D/E)XK nuclease family protein [Candidatus Omnitrophota bacterium]